MGGLVASSSPVPPGQLPPLIHAPPINLSDSRDHMIDVRMQLNGVQTPARIDEWIDVGFFIGADGKVGDVDVLRESPTRHGDWIEPVLAAIKARRYARR